MALGNIYDPKSKRWVIDPRSGPIYSQRAAQDTPFILSIGETERGIAEAIDRSKTRASRISGIPYRSPETEVLGPPAPPEDSYGNLRQQFNIAANRAAMDNLRNIVQNNTLNNEQLQMRARKSVAPIFRPQIREFKRNIRQTERQGRVAADQVQGYYNQAGQKVAGMARGSRKATKRSVKETMAGGVQGNAGATAESRIAAGAMKGMGKANASFFKQLRGALAGEGAVAAADTRRNYKDLANQYRGDLADLRSERAAAMQEAVGKIRGNINKTARAVYNDNYLQLLNQGIPARKAQAAALAQAGTYGQAIEAKAAQLILKNKGDEKLLAKALKKKGLTEEQWNRKQDRQRSNETIVKGWQAERDAAMEEFKDTGSDAARKRAAFYQAKINTAYGV